MLMLVAKKENTMKSPAADLATAIATIKTGTHCVVAVVDLDRQ